MVFFRHKSLVIVVASHLLVILIMWLGTLTWWRTREPVVPVRVRLASLPNLQPVSPPSSQAPANPSPQFQPKATPRPQPKPTPKPVPKPTAKPTAAAPKKVAKKTPVPAKPKAKRRLRTAEEIRRSARLTPVAPSKPASPPTRQLDNRSLEAAVRRSLNTGQSSTTPSPASSASNQQVARQYFEAITAVFYRAWQQPSRREAGGGAPVVSVNLVIARDGRILNWSMGRASKNAVMNKSVIRAVSNVKRLPQFSDYNLGGSQMSVDINFQLD